MPLIGPPKSKKVLARPPLRPIDPDDNIPMNGDGLPTEATDQNVSLTSLGWLFVAPPGFGKSEFFATFPDCLMLACEAGHKFITGHKLIIDEWAGSGSTTDTDGNIHVSFLEAVKRILASDRFKFIIVDTLDALVKKCIDHHLGKAGQQHISELGDYGKGYDMGQNDPIRKVLNDLFMSGRGVGLITHQQIETRSFTKGVKSKKETTLPNGIYKIVYPQMDIIIHGEFGGVREGNKHHDRIIKSEGSEDILAKNRGGILPPAWISPLDIAERGAQVREFFEGDTSERKEHVDAAYAEYCEFYVSE